MAMEIFWRAIELGPTIGKFRSGKGDPQREDSVVIWFSCWKEATNIQSNPYGITALSDNAPAHKT
jgi:hypothetical protein